MIRNLFIGLAATFLLSDMTAAFSMFSVPEHAKEYFLGKPLPSGGDHSSHDRHPDSLWGFLQGPPPPEQHIKRMLLDFPVKDTVSRFLQRTDGFVANHPSPDTTAARKTISICRDLLDQADKFLTVLDNPAQYEEFLKSYPDEVKYLFMAWKNQDFDSLDKAITASKLDERTKDSLLTLLHGDASKAKDTTTMALNPLFDQLRVQSRHLVMAVRTEEILAFLDDPASVKDVTTKWINDVFDALEEYILSKRPSVKTNSLRRREEEPQHGDEHERRGHH